MKLRNLLLALLAFVFFACPDKEDEVPQGSLNVEATIDGQSWTGAGNSRVTNVAGFIAWAIGAGSADGTSMALTLDAERTGNFDLASGKAVWITSSQVVYHSTSGTVNITKLEGDKVSGTFSFKAKQLTGTGPELTITNGKFTDINIMR